MSLPDLDSLPIFQMSCSLFRLWMSKRRTTTNLKTKNNQNWQKIELYGNPITEELKKKYLPRPVGGQRWAAWWRGLTARQHLEDRVVPPSWADKLGGTTGEWDRPTTQGSSREMKSQTSDWKHLWGLRQQQAKLPASQESSLERPTGSQNIHKIAHPPSTGNQHQKGPICLGRGGSD